MKGSGYNNKMSRLVKRVLIFWCHSYSSDGFYELMLPVLPIQTIPGYYIPYNALKEEAMSYD